METRIGLDNLGKILSERKRLNFSFDDVSSFKICCYVFGYEAGMKKRFSIKNKLLVNINHFFIPALSRKT